MRQTSEFEHLQALAQAVRTLGPGLDHAQAQAALGLVDAIRQTNDPDQLQALAQALGAIGPNARTGRGRPRPSSRRHPDHRPTDSELRPLGPGPGLQSWTLGPPGSRAQVGPDEAKRAGEVVRTALATTDEPSVCPGARSMRSRCCCRRNRRGAYVDAVAELLKWPTTAGPARRMRCWQALHERVPGAPGKEAGLDATVAWVAATYPDIDLDSPPTFPASGSTGGAWSTRHFSLRSLPAPPRRPRQYPARPRSARAPGSPRPLVHRPKIA